MSEREEFPPPGTVAIERRDGMRIVSLQGEHDISTVDLVRERLGEAGVGDGVVIVEPRLRQVHRQQRRGRPARGIPSRPAGADAVRGGSGDVAEGLFTVLGFDGCVPIFERLEDALA
jgi:hypothetical protein